MDLLSREPVLTIGVVEAFLALLLSFGVGLTAEQVGAVVAASAAVLSWIARTKVTPTANPRLDDGHGDVA